LYLLFSSYFGLYNFECPNIIICWPCDTWFRDGDRSEPHNLQVQDIISTVLTVITDPLHLIIIILYRFILNACSTISNNLTTYIKLLVCMTTMTRVLITMRDIRHHWLKQSNLAYKLTLIAPIEEPIFFFCWREWPTNFIVIKKKSRLLNFDFSRHYGRIYYFSFHCIST